MRSKPFVSANFDNYLLPRGGDFDNFFGKCQNPHPMPEPPPPTSGLRERSAGSFPEQRLGSNRTNCTNQRNVQYNEDIITRVHPFPRPSSDMNVFFISHSVVAKFVVNKCTLHCWKPRPVPFQLVTGQYFTFANSFVWNE